MDEKKVEVTKKKLNLKETIYFVKKYWKLLIVVLVVVLVLIAAISLKLSSNDELYIEDTTFLINELQKASDLTTAKLKTNCFSQVKDNGVWFLSRSDFLMTYTVYVEAGIDVKKVEISADNINKQIVVGIPKAEIQTVKVDSSSIKFYDEKFALFNLDQKEDVNRAVVQAEEEAQKQAMDIGALELAESQSEIIVKGILANAIPDGFSIIVYRIEE